MSATLVIESTSAPELRELVDRVLESKDDLQNGSQLVTLVGILIRWDGQIRALQEAFNCGAEDDLLASLVRIAVGLHVLVELGRLGAVALAVRHAFLGKAPRSTAVPFCN